jgi:predicted MFS family arabinose efflux permease
MMMPWGSAFAVNNLHVSYEQLPLLFMASGIAALIIMPLIGKLSDKIDKAKLFTVAALSMMVIIVIYTNLTPVPFLLIITLNILMMTAIMSRIVPAMALVFCITKNAGSWRIHEHQFIFTTNCGSVVCSWLEE